MVGRGWESVGERAGVRRLKGSLGWMGVGSRADWMSERAGWVVGRDIRSGWVGVRVGWVRGRG